MNQRTKSSVILIISLVSFSGLFADAFNKVGTTGFVFLQLPVSARYMALGETGITLNDANAEGLFVNPAAICLNDQQFSFTTSYSKWYVETNHHAAGLTYNWRGIGTVGIQMVYFDFGEMKQTRNPASTEFGSYVELGTFSADAYALGLSYARRLTNQFAFGATVKYVRENIARYYASNMIADIGFIYFTGFKSLRIGAFLQNFGLDAKYVDEKFKMPQQLKLGLSAEVLGNLGDNNYLTVLAEAAHPNDINEHFLVGLEGVVMRYVVLRGGYKFGYEDENLTLGLGLRFLRQGKQVRFDAAFMQHRHFDATMRYTLSVEL